MSAQNWKPLVGKTAKGQELVLRRYCPEDLDLVGSWINTPEMRSKLSVEYPISLKEEGTYLEKAMAPLGSNPTEIHLAICLEGAIIGGCGLHEISSKHRRAVVGLYIGNQELRGLGIGSEVYRLLAEFAFKEMNLESLRADVYEHNVASQRLHERMGFQLVGRIPKWFFREGEYRDVFIYYLSREMWLKR